MIADRDLYERGAATLLASWDAYARGTSGAALLRLDGVAAGVFPRGPERDVYNNALLSRGAGAGAVDAMETVYAGAGIDRFAAWVHESEEAMRAELARRGYAITESTRAMGLVLDELAAPEPELGLASLPWPDYLAYLVTSGLPEGLLAGTDPSAFRVLAAVTDEGPVATAMSLDHDGDCAVTNVGTLPHARDRGFATALTARHLHDARARGCATATIQSTPVAERLYARLGYRDLGRYLEFSPG